MTARRNGTLRPEIAAIVSMLAEVCLDDFEAELAVASADDAAQAIDSGSERQNRDPDSSSTIQAVNAAPPRKVRILYGD